MIHIISIKRSKVITILKGNLHHPSQRSRYKQPKQMITISIHCMLLLLLLFISVNRTQRKYHCFGCSSNKTTSKNWITSRSISIPLFQIFIILSSSFPPSPSLNHNSIYSAQAKTTQSACGIFMLRVHYPIFSKSGIQLQQFWYRSLISNMFNIKIYIHHKNTESVLYSVITLNRIIP